MNFWKSKKLAANEFITQPLPGDNIIADNKIGGLDPISLNEEVLRWIFSILGSLITYFVVAIIVQSAYHPDINALNDTAQQLLLNPEFALPEPMEALLFRLGVVVILPALYSFYLLFSRTKFVSLFARKPYFIIASAMSISALITMVYFDFAIKNEAGGPTSAYISNLNLYFNNFFIGNYLWLYAFVVAPLVCCLFFIGIKKYNWESKKAFRVVTATVSYVVIVTVLLEIIAMNIFSFPYSNDNKVDFNAVYYSMTQVYAGTPMLVNSFTNTYGLYPHFLNPLFQIIGLDVFKFSAVMSLLIGLSFILIFYTLKKIVRNQAILFLGCCTVLFFSYIDRILLGHFDCNFALFPIRYLIPCTLLYLSYLYLSKPSAKIYWFTFILIAFSVLWNPEIGLVCYVSWCVTNIYKDFYTTDRKVSIKKMLYHLLAGVAVLIVVFYSYKLLVYAFYGSFSDLGLLWKTMYVFSAVGFNMLPMKLVHPWNLVALILILGFLYSIVKLSKREVTPKSSIVLLISLIGLGYLFYFQGRSHSINLSAGSGFCIMLLTILGDDLWQMIKTMSVFLLNALFVVFIFLVSFSFIELVYNADSIYKLVYQEEEKPGQMQEQAFVENNKEFILQNSEKNEKIYVLTVYKLQGLYFDGSKRRSAVNPGFVDMFLKTDLERLQNEIKDSSFSIFIEPGIFNYKPMQHLAAEVAALYEFNKASQSMALITKRKTALPVRSFFKSSGDLVVYRKYTDDITGLTSRIDDNFGIPVKVVAPEFSVQVLFYAQPQLYPYACVIGNSRDGKGFVIGNEINSSNYFFVVNAKSCKVQLQNNKWSYCVMNVYPDQFDIYVNGILAGSNSLQRAMLASVSQLCIGNLGYMHYYVGAISEVSVENKILDKTQVEATWNDIAHSINQ
jgi:hypothetical protein